MAENRGVNTSTMPPVQCRGSHTTTRPKIKIIHIVAPEIIKTDVANFRDLVQQLTGKPTTGATSSTNTPPPPVEEDKETVIKKRKPLPPAAAPVKTAERSDLLVQQEPMSKKIKCEVKVEEGGCFGDYGLDCNDLWMDLDPGAGSFLSFLEEELEVLQGLQATDHDDFLQMPLGPAARMNFVGEMYAS